MKGVEDYFGTCLVNGQHKIGSPLAQECPLLRGTKKAVEAAKRAGRYRGTDPPVKATEKRRKPTQLQIGFMSPPKRGGRPRKHADKKAASRESSRAHRKRPKKRYHQASLFA